MERRNFFKYLAGGSAFTLYSLTKANAAIYQNLALLNQDYFQDESPDGPYWESVAKHFIFQDNFIMMNNGTVGPMPQPVFNTLMKYFKIQATNPYDFYNFLPRKRDEIRMRLAKFINASPDEVVINRNTTEGMNLFANGLDLTEGDEVIMSSHEHPGGLHPWKLKEKRYGIKVKEVNPGAPPKSVDEVINAFKNAITPRTKVFSVSHTVYITGLIFPVKELSDLAHENNILVIADSAHGMGMLNIDVKKLGIDAFASSPYKWLGAPTGCGVLYVKKEIQDRLWPCIASSGWDTYENARKFETLGQRAEALFFALGEAVDFQNVIGKTRIERRIKSLAGYLKDELKAIPKVRLHTSTDQYLSGGLTAFSIEGVKPETIVNYLREKYNVVIRTIGRDRDNTRGVRVSTHIYISRKHIDMVLEGVNYLVRSS
jgi:selenocysteine lyase/cysteine desulfurase